MSGKGANFERLCAHTLRDAGWHVIRAAGSKGHADLWAARTEGTDLTRLLWVQVKAGKNGMGPREWNEFLYAATDAGAVPLLADKLSGIVLPQWWRITAPKTGRLGERQPRAPFDIEAWHDDTVAA